MSRLREPESWFKDSRGEPFRITTLSAELAKVHRHWLVKAHNEIPFQHWTQKELFAAGDGSRSFRGKWELSKIALSSAGAPLGFCIGFEMAADSEYYHQAGIYLHRLAVAPNVQGRMIGVLIQAETIVQVFLRGLRFVGNARDPVVIFGQTNLTPQNDRVRLFHKAAGFREVGYKTYPDREDVILRMDATEFWSSRHLSIWRSTRIPAPTALHTPRQEPLRGGRATRIQRALSDVSVAPKSRTILAEVKDMVSRLTGIPSTEILDTDDVREFLALDSLQMTELWLTLQQRFRMDPEDSAIHELGSVAAIAHYLARKLARNC